MARRDTTENARLTVHRSTKAALRAFTRPAFFNANMEIIIMNLDHIVMYPWKDAFNIKKSNVFLRLNSVFTVYVREVS